MPATSHSANAVIGIDIGKNSFHIAGLDDRGAIVLRQKWARSSRGKRRSRHRPHLQFRKPSVGAERREPHAGRYGSDQRHRQPPDEMKLLGTDHVFTLTNSKAHYDAIGSYLHIPSLEQLQTGKFPIWTVCHRGVKQSLIDREGAEFARLQQHDGNLRDARRMHERRLQEAHPKEDARRQGYD